MITGIHLFVKPLLVCRARRLETRSDAGGNAEALFVRSGAVDTAGVILQIPDGDVGVQGFVEHIAAAQIPRRRKWRRFCMLRMR